MWGMAERAKLSVYIIFGILFSIVIYPVVAHWVWGGGWLGKLGMQDYAGSTVVHLTGATAALVATLLLKPRLGKFNKDGKPNIILVITRCTLSWVLLFSGLVGLGLTRVVLYQL